MPSKATMASALTSPDGSSTRMSKLSKGSSFSHSSDPPSGSAPAPKPAPIKGSLKKPRHGVFESSLGLRQIWVLLKVSLIMYSIDDTFILLAQTHCLGRHRCISTRRAAPAIRSQHSASRASWRRPSMTACPTSARCIAHSLRQRTNPRRPSRTTSGE